jgi:arylsulfatase A-like enzyme
MRVGNALHPFWRRRLHIETHRQVFSLVPAIAADRQFDLVMMHAPVPHPPYIFDPRREALSWLDFGLSYDDNIALADQYLAAIRDAMMQAGLWDETAVVISADHGDRSRLGDRRDMEGVLPLLVKMPGQRRGATVDTAVKGEIQHDLILALIDGRQWHPDRPNH